MLIRSLMVLALLLTQFTSPLVAIPPAQAQDQQIGIPELMQATALDVVFTQFGPTIASSARAQDISRDEIFLKHWEATANSVFDADDLHRRLTRSLEGKFFPEEQSALGAFFHAELGQRLTELERQAALLEPQALGPAISQGERLVDEASVIRKTQIDALMELVSAEISAAMVGQSVRALLLGLSVSHQHGDIAVPWQEIDTQVQAMMPGLLTDVSNTQRAMMAYAYRNLSDGDLDRYIEFLRTPAAQKFYAVATYAIGRIVADGMSAFGEAFAARMQSVNV